MNNLVALLICSKQLKNWSVTPLFERSIWWSYVVPVVFVLLVGLIYWELMVNPLVII